MTEQVYTVIGLMSGTSLDGIDAALIRTNGRDYAESIGFNFMPYQPSLRRKIRACLGRREDHEDIVRSAERALTMEHASAVKALLHRTGYDARKIDAIGFHGHTISHDPDNKFTWQIGDGALLAHQTGIPVVSDMRRADVEAGGQGAPFLPLNHYALATEQEKPFVILNLGGVGNLTYIGRNEDEILAFDTGPGNSLIDLWVRTKARQYFDMDGKLALKGSVQKLYVDQWIQDPYYAQAPAKSLDITSAWKEEKQDMEAATWSVEDGAATLAAYTVETIVKAQDFLPEKARHWYVSGGGRHNKAIMLGLHERTNALIAPVEELGWDGDALEAEGFGYLAVRSILGLPLSLPTTTGVPQPTTGGVLTRPEDLGSKQTA